MTEKTVTTCDKCGNVFWETDTILNAGSYDVHFHLSCLEELTVPEFIVLMSMDDIRVMKLGDWENSTKANSYFRRRQ